MKFNLYGLMGVALIALLSGCIPEQRVIWSPDGRQAMVLGRENNLQSLYLCDGDGNLSPRLFDHVHRAAWRPDSSGVILVRSRLTANWAELAPLLTAEENDDIIRMAGIILHPHGPAIRDDHIEALEEEDNTKNAGRMYLRH